MDLDTFIDKYRPQVGFATTWIPWLPLRFGSSDDLLSAFGSATANALGALVAFAMGDTSWAELHDDGFVDEAEMLFCLDPTTGEVLLYSPKTGLQLFEESLAEFERSLVPWMERW